MGIKNIHVVLIAVSVLLGVFFALWSLNNGHKLWSVCAIASVIALGLYGFTFLKKYKSL